MDSTFLTRITPMYELVGDYYFLLAGTAEENSRSAWGVQRHKQYLKEHRPALYNALLLERQVWPATLLTLTSRHRNEMNLNRQQMDQARYQPRG